MHELAVMQFLVEAVEESVPSGRIRACISRSATPRAASRVRLVFCFEVATLGNEPRGRGPRGGARGWGSGPRHGARGLLMCATCGCGNCGARTPCARLRRAAPPTGRDRPPRQERSDRDGRTGADSRSAGVVASQPDELARRREDDAPRGRPASRGRSRRARSSRAIRRRSATRCASVPRAPRQCRSTRAPAATSTRRWSREDSTSSTRRRDRSS
jgi:hypothetical protein